MSSISVASKNCRNKAVAQKTLRIRLKKLQKSLKTLISSTFLACHLFRSPNTTKNALLSTDKGAFFELSVPQAEREVCFASEAHFVREVCLRHDMRNT